MTRLSIPLLACLLGALSAVHGAAATLSSAQHEQQAQVDDSHQLHAIQHFSKISGRTMPPPIQVRNEDQTTRVKRADDGLTFHYDGFFFMSYFSDPTNTCSTVPASTTFTGIGVCRYSQKITEVMIDPSMNSIKLTYSFYEDTSCTQLTSTYVASNQMGCYYNSLAGWSQNVTLPEGTPAVGGFVTYNQYVYGNNGDTGTCNADMSYQTFTALNKCTFQYPSASRSVRAITSDDGTVYNSEYTFDDSECNGQISYAYTYAVPTGCYYNTLQSLVQVADVPTGTTLGPVYLKESTHYSDTNKTCASAPDQINYYGGLEVCLNQAHTSSYTYVISAGNNLVKKVNTTYTTPGCNGVVSFIEINSYFPGVCVYSRLTEVVSSIVPPSVDGVLEKLFLSSDQCGSNALPFKVTWAPTGVCRNYVKYTCENNVGNRSSYNNPDCDGAPNYSTIGYTNCASSYSDRFFNDCMSNCGGSRTFSCTAPWTPEPSQSPVAKPSFKPTQKVGRKPTVKPSKQPTKKPNKKPTLAPTKRPTLRPTKKPNRKPSQTTASVDSASVSASASAPDVKMSMFDTLMAGIRGWANI